MLRNRREAGQRTGLRCLNLAFVPGGAAGVQSRSVPIATSQKEPGRSPGVGFEVGLVPLAQQPAGQLYGVRVVVHFLDRGRSSLLADASLSKFLLKHAGAFRATPCTRGNMRSGSAFVAHAVCPRDIRNRGFYRSRRIPLAPQSSFDFIGGALRSCCQPHRSSSRKFRFLFGQRRAYCWKHCRPIGQAQSANKRRFRHGVTPVAEAQAYERLAGRRLNAIDRTGGNRCPVQRNGFARHQLVAASGVTTASGSASAPPGSPASRRISFSIVSARSGFSPRKALAFSRPCPIRWSP